MPDNLFSVISWRAPGRVSREPRSAKSHITLLPSPCNERYLSIGLGLTPDVYILSSAHHLDLVRSIVASVGAPAWVAEIALDWLRPNRHVSVPSSVYSPTGINWTVLA